MIEITGESEKGMTLGDVRRFIEATAGLSDRTWIDCRVPTAAHGTAVAALMGLSCGTDE